MHAVCARGKQAWHSLPGWLVIHGKMPPLPSVEEPRDEAFFGAAFFLAIMDTAARESATLESCSGAGVNAAALWGEGGKVRKGERRGVRNQR